MRITKELGACVDIASYNANYNSGVVFVIQGTRLQNTSFICGRLKLCPTLNHFTLKRSLPPVKIEFPRTRKVDSGVCVVRTANNIGKYLTTKVAASLGNKKVELKSHYSVIVAKEIKRTALTCRPQNWSLDDASVSCKNRCVLPVELKDRGV